MTDHTDSWFTPRHWIAVTATLAGMVAVYLHLWKYGYMGQLTCDAHASCEAVMTSRWGMFWGVDVALIGSIGYALILGVALIGLQERELYSTAITKVLALLVVTGFVFTLRLKYFEFFVMHKFCRWCAISAVIITTQLIAVALDWRRVRGLRNMERG